MVFVNGDHSTKFLPTSSLFTLVGVSFSMMNHENKTIKCLITAWTMKTFPSENYPLYGI